MSKMVLCIDRFALEEQNIPIGANGIYPFDLNKVSPEDFHFINRKVVDSGKELYKNMAYYFPQILPYITVTDGEGKYLSYSRNGTETRLHGSRSIGIGGHVDIYDSYDTYNEEDTYWQSIEATILSACRRELEEEISLTCGDWLVSKTNLGKLIVDTTNPVGEVHVGLFSELVYPYAQPQEELHDAKWVTVEELKASIDEYENWSKLIIEGL